MDGLNHQLNSLFLVELEYFCFIRIVGGEILVIHSLGRSLFPS